MVGIELFMSNRQDLSHEGSATTSRDTEWRAVIPYSVFIRAVLPANAEDPRGPTFEFWKDQGVQAAQQITACERYAGCLVGNHYHLGKDRAKNPERFILWSGSARLLVCDGVVTRAPRISASQHYKTEIQIDPLILHAILPYEDIEFFEHRATRFDKNNSDTYGPETFLKTLNVDPRSKQKALNCDSFSGYSAALEMFKDRAQRERITEGGV